MQTVKEMKTKTNKEDELTAPQENETMPFDIDFIFPDVLKHMNTKVKVRINKDSLNTIK